MKRNKIEKLYEAERRITTTRIISDREITEILQVEVEEVQKVSKEEVQIIFLLYGD